MVERGVKKVCDILFRAKAINRDKGYHKTTYKNGDWVYGLVTRLYDGRFENLPAEMTDINGVSGIEVDYKTIGQYTGVTDNNSRKIFEGDIVKRVLDGERAVISWLKYSACFGLSFDGWCCGFDNYDDNLPSDFEVIGNIHDNPEILKTPSM